MAKTSTARSGQVIAAAFGSGTPVVIGSLICVDGAGVPYVDFPGNPHAAPLPARFIGTLGAPLEGQVAVALAFEGSDRSAPLILGPVNDRIVPSANCTLSRTVTPAEAPKEVVIDGRKIALNADSELLLRCGNASILLRRDGKLVIKGTEVVSRASGANKIRGGLVNIN